MTSKAVPYLLQGKNVILVIDNKSHTISKDTHISYGKIIDALKNKDWDALRDLVEPRKALVNFGKGHVSIKGNDVFWKDQPFHNALSSRMIEMYSEGFPIDPLVSFMENLMNNPSKRSIDQIYGFLDKNSLPITPDGYFLAFKKVDNNYLDIHSHTISNHVGAIVEMDRNQVDDNPDSHCSTGLHFCSIDYLSGFGSAGNPVMILKINPADVVSIPTDANGAKGRCCRYEVVGEVVGDPKDAFTKIVNGEYSPKPVPVVKKAKTVKTVNSSKEESIFDINDLMDTDDISGDDYDVVSWKDHNNVIAHGRDIFEARELVARNARQKKVKLVIIDKNTGKEVQ